MNKCISQYFHSFLQEKKSECIISIFCEQLKHLVKQLGNAHFSKCYTNRSNLCICSILSPAADQYTHGAFETICVGRCMWSWLNTNYSAPLRDMEKKYHPIRKCGLDAFFFFLILFWQQRNNTQKIQNISPWKFLCLHQTLTTAECKSHESFWCLYEFLKSLSNDVFLLVVAPNDKMLMCVIFWGEWQPIFLFTPPAKSWQCSNS